MTVGGLAPNDDTDGRVAALLGQAARARAAGRVAEAATVQLRAVSAARELLAQRPLDPRLRRGLAGALGTAGAMLTEAGDPDRAVAALDDSHDIYDGLRRELGVVREEYDVEFRLADVLAWRGRAQSVRGRGASAVVDTDAAVMTYLGATEGTFDHPRAGGLARVSAVHASVLARHGDPAMAVVAADFALAYYAGTDEEGQRGNAYLRDSALVSALRYLSTGSIARGLDQAVIAAATIQRNLRHPALWERLRLLAELVDEGRVVAPSVALGRDTADLLHGQLRETGMPWCPDPARLGVRAPTLADAIIQAGGDATLVAALTMNQPDGLLLTPSLRWLPSLPVGPVLRVAELAVGALPASPAAGMRLALDAHAMFAAAHRGRADAAPVPFAAYGGPWLRLLETASAACTRAGERELAADLDGWADSIRARCRSARSA